MTSKFHTFLLTWWLTQQVTGLSVLNTQQSIKLDMAPDAFDDQYEGCVEAMEKKAPQLLQEDFEKNMLLKSKWEEAKDKWKMIKTTVSHPKGFHDFHGTALVAYTGPIYKDFNEAVRTFKNNPSNFHYRAFHYYLTRALQLLNKQNCQTVYRGSKTKFHYSGGGPVRFGQFASSSSESSIALVKYGGASGTLLKIYTCSGVSIKEFSYYPEDKEVLIPGYEVYYSIQPDGNGNKEIILNSPKRGTSNFNCFYSGSTDSSHFSSSGVRVSCVFLLLVVLPGLLV